MTSTAYQLAALPAEYTTNENTPDRPLRIYTGRVWGSGPYTGAVVGFIYSRGSDDVHASPSTLADRFGGSRRTHEGILYRFVKAQLLARVRRGVYRLTKHGREVLDDETRARRYQLVMPGILAAMTPAVAAVKSAVGTIGNSRKSARRLGVPWGTFCDHRKAETHRNPHRRPEKPTQAASAPEERARGVVNRSETKDNAQSHHPPGEGTTGAVRFYEREREKHDFDTRAELNSAYGLSTPVSRRYKTAAVNAVSRSSSNADTVLSGMPLAKWEEIEEVLFFGGPDWAEGVRGLIEEARQNHRPKLSGALRTAIDWGWRDQARDAVKSMLRDAINTRNGFNPGPTAGVGTPA